MYRNITKRIIHHLRVPKHRSDILLALSAEGISVHDTSVTVRGAPLKALMWYFHNEYAMRREQC